MKTIAFFNNKGGVGKTSLVYHLGWMLSEQGYSVVCADLDPQANLSAMFLDEERLEELWPESGERHSVAGSVNPILRGLGDLQSPHLEVLSERLALIPGDMTLARFEAKLSDDWSKCADGDEAAFRSESAFHRLIQDAGRQRHADVALIDVGPNLGAINRSALLAASHVLVPVAADLFSLHGLQNLGPTLREWRKQWQERITHKPVGADFDLPAGNMQPIGYVILQHAVRADRPVKAYARWVERIPGTYRDSVLNDPTDTGNHCLASLKNYRSLMPYAQDARKPVFALKPADGALGGHQNAVKSCFLDFKQLAERIAQAAGLPRKSQE